MRGWQGQPRKMVEYERTGKKKESNIRSPGCRAVGCNLAVLKSTISRCKITLQIQAPFSATPCEQFKVLSALVQRCDARHFILNEAVRNSALALH
jgi:hypothetical protein